MSGLRDLRCQSVAEYNQNLTHLLENVDPSLAEL